MKVTIGLLANKLGVSISTVSNALNNKGKVSPETREKILALARELGYPIENSSLKKDKKFSKKIGVLFPWHSTANDPNYYISEVLVGVEEQIKQEGFSLLIESFQNTSELPELLNQNLEGLLLIGGQFPEDFIVELARRDYPVLTIGTYTSKVPLHAVVADNQAGAYQAATHLLNLGHRNIGFINGPATTLSSRSKLAGFKQALTDFGMDIHDTWITSSEFKVESGYELAKQLVMLKNRPTALFAADDPIAIGLIKGLQDQGLSVPEDMAVVGFGNSPTGKYISPSLTTIDVFQRKLGNHGARRLMELIRQRRNGTAKDDIDTYRLVYSTRLVVRDSCGAGRGS